MASIRKRGSNSYLIVVSRGYDYEGNRLKSVQKTVKPPKEYVRTVASLLGHAQASTTLDIYAHAFDKNKRKAQEKLGKAIGL